MSGTDTKPVLDGKREIIECDDITLSLIQKSRYFVLGDGEANKLVFSLREALDYDSHRFSYIDCFGESGGERLVSLKLDNDEIWKPY